jgi:ribosomal protein L7Ae-like RNA K-turn-binding protein
MAKKKTGKTRFVFGKDMTPEEMVDAVTRMAKENNIPFEDDRKKRGIPIVDSRKKERNRASKS